MNAKQLISEVKAFGEDNELFPTTNEIIDVMQSHLLGLKQESFHSPIRDNLSIMDCGAGTGKLFSRLKELGVTEDEYGNKSYPLYPTECYAIEKSPILLSNLPNDVLVVGTDFWAQTLIDKNVDVIFSNPPFSQFSTWVEKLIREANAYYIYLVIPSRWKTDPLIKMALEDRGLEASVIEKFDFMDAEDRAARAKVDLVFIQVHKNRTGSKAESAFSLWFDDAFGLAGGGKPEAEYKAEKKAKEERKTEIIESKGLVVALEELYTKEKDKVLDNYKKIVSLDATILGELGVNQDDLIKSLRLKMESMKDKYWKELFDNLDKITSRLTLASREELTKKLFSNTHVDFTVSNAYAILEWAIRNSNSFYEQQLVDTFQRMVDKANVKAYVSNQRTFEAQDWSYRYEAKKKVSHIKLDYRVILSDVGALRVDSCNGNIEGLEKGAANFINDLVTIANNLGFSCENDARLFDWRGKQQHNLMFDDLKTGTEQVLMNIKAHKNGNLHIKFNQAFIFKLNVEMGRLKGWISSPNEAVDEMDIPEDIAVESFGANFAILPKQINTLLLN